MKSVAVKMLCPKCKEYFEEGSRRFCPTDGARLVSEASGIGGRSEGGIFANLIPKIEGIRALDETLNDRPRFTVTEARPSAPANEQSEDMTDGIFFELDEIQPDAVPAPKFVDSPDHPEVESIPAEAKTTARKINLHEIPAGHVDLGDASRSQGLAAEFEINDPEHFVGRTVKGRYHVSEFLGGDESGLAYLADDKIVDDRMVLVRVLTGGDADEIMDSILAEERVSLSHFSHPNIARLIDSGQFTNGTNFIISEYVDALSVRDILSIHSQFGASRAARIIRQAASALNEAHQEGILHRDVRPENLIIDTAAGETEQTKLVNFGASNGDPTPRNIAYKAHEVLDGRIATVSSDIFSLGVVAYEMLSGRLPFSGGSAKELVRSQNAGFDEPELGRSVNEVFARVFAYNAADRYPKARDFGDAFYGALAEPAPFEAPVEKVAPQPAPVRTETLKPIVPAAAALVASSADASSESKPAVPAATPPAWKMRSPEPPQLESTRSRLVPLVGFLALVGLAVGGWYYVSNNQSQPAVPAQGNDIVAVQTNSASSPAAAPVTEMPPQPRSIQQPPNSDFYQNIRQNLKGDLLRNFVGFTIYYPKDWTVNGPQEGATTKIRGKFLDISRLTPEGVPKEQMLISYYPSRGTFAGDAALFPEMVKETNETLKGLVPEYQMVSEREIKFNGEWRAYEIKFQGGRTSENGEKLLLWGRRLFVPAARPGARNGFEITMLATSAAENVRGVDDIGVSGELAPILHTFEPSQNF